LAIGQREVVYEVAVIRAGLPEYGLGQFNAMRSSARAGVLQAVEDAAFILADQFQ
jgi:hypothetical protein